MFSLSLGHIIVLLIVAILFGPKRLSTLAEQLGKSLRGVKEQMNAVTEPIHTARSKMQEFRDDLNPLKAATETKDETKTN